MVFNKVDRMESGEALERLKLLHKEALFVSARTGEGLDHLKEAISDQLNAQLRSTQLLIPHDRYDVVSKLYSSGGIRHQATDDEGVHIEGLFSQSIQGIIAPFLISK